MNLTLDDEQRQLQASVARYMAQRYGVAKRHEIAASAAGYSREAWQDFAGFGWLALPLPEAHGGLGGSAVDVGLLMQAFGRSLVMEPYVSTVLLAGGLIASVGSTAQQAAWLPGIAEGRTLMALAHAEGSRHQMHQVQTTAQHTPQGWVLSGSKRVVLDGPLADVLVVSARLADAPARLALFLVGRDAIGLQQRALRTVDGRHAADLQLEQVALAADALLGEGQVTDALPALEATLDRTRAALAAEALGCMRALLETTLDYCRTRVQFDQPLSANQVLRHRMVDMAVQCEESESMALLAALKADAPANERALAVSAAMDKIVRGARFVAEQAVQLHGAMGVTEEVAVGAWLKRLLHFEAMLGTPGYHLKRHARLRGLTVGATNSATHAAPQTLKA